MSNPYGDKITGPMAKAGLTRIIFDGLIAEQKLRGATDVIAPDNKEVLEALVKAGKETQEECIREGLEACVRQAKRKAGVVDGQ